MRDMPGSLYQLSPWELWRRGDAFDHCKGYVDIAVALAIIIPLSTIFVLQLFKKGVA